MKKSNKKYRIKSKSRFITFIVILLCLFAGIIGHVTGFDISTALARETVQTQIEVVPGDTLWDIAGHYKSEDKDIREAVYEICSANDITDGNITEGMVLSIPESL